MRPSLGAALQRLLPQRIIGRVVYRLARCRIRPVKNLLIASFNRWYAPDLAEAQVTQPLAYPDFNAFFTRALKSGARQVADDPQQVVSPVDGMLTEFGTLDDDRLLQAKGMRYSVSALLGEDGKSLTAFSGGCYVTIYLAPVDYHRVHAPVAGRLQATRYLPGTRFSVNAATARSVRDLFCRNERVALWLDGACGRYALVMVGAFNVSSISTVTRGEIASGPAMYWPEPDTPQIEIGAELGRFNLGSTVVLIFPRGAVRWSDGLRSGAHLCMGERIGSLSGEEA